MKDEEEKQCKLNFAENNEIKSLASFQDKFPPLNRQWKIIYKNNMTKLSRIASSQNDKHDALEEIFATENAISKGIDMKIFTPINF